MIYHIINKDRWNEVKTLKTYRPNSLDRDGYIHCSYENQVLKVADTFLRGQKDLLILCINEKDLGDCFKSEDLFNLQEVYPHIYGELPINAVERVIKLEVSDRGDFIKPDFNPLSSLTVKLDEWT